jgi:hypothetical protein
MSIDAKSLFKSLQDQLEASLAGARAVLSHPGAKGTASEDNWIAMLRAHMPHRYQIDKAFVVDSEGGTSHEIDIVIYDRQYTPLLYNLAGQRFVPAESVYAILESKQTFDKGNLEYAGRKAASVRNLKRTSSKIIHAGGEFEARGLPRILAGIVAFDSAWSPALGEALVTTLSERPEAERLDFGCAVSAGSFEVQYGESGIKSFNQSEASTALFFFFLTLLHCLQTMGTVPAIDYQSYLVQLETGGSKAGEKL